MSAADLGIAIRRLRYVHEPPLSTQELALDAGMHPGYLSGIERGLRNPTWVKVNSLAEALQVPLVHMIQVANRSASPGRISVQAQPGRVYANAADLGRAIRRLRCEHEPPLFMQTLALDAGMDLSYLSGIENGLRNPTWAKLNDLAQALQTPLERIVQTAEQEARSAQARSQIEAENNERAVAQEDIMRVIHSWKYPCMRASMSAAPR